MGREISNVSALVFIPNFRAVCGMKLGLHDIRDLRQIDDPDGFENEIRIFKTKRFHKS